MLGSAYKSEKHDRRRGEVLDATAAVFAEKGFHNARLKDIAARLNLLPGSLYHYLDSKEQALIEVCARSGRSYIEAMREVLRREAPVDERILQAIRNHLRNNRRELVYSFAFRHKDLPETALRELAAMSGEYQTMWEDLLRQGVAKGELPADLDCHVTAVGLLSMCNGAIDWYESKPEAEIEAIADRFAALVNSGLMPR